MLILCSIIATSVIKAQEEPPADSKGTEFWFTFPPNYHNNFSDVSNTDDQLYIFIAADEPTLVELHYSNMLGGKFVKKIDIQDPNDIEIISLNYRGLELQGWNESGNYVSENDPRNLNETPVPASFRVISEEDVSVYIQNQAMTTSDATLVYPVDALGKNYFVMSYYAGLRGSVSASTPSQFAIVATEDNTEIEITPPKNNPTEKHGDEPFSVTLNRGESYLVQSKPTGTIPYDLTGTHIVASAPIAVFGGHQRAQVPLDVDAFNPSRDYLIQQIIPVESWHKSAYVIPFETVSNGIRNKDLVRVLSASDNNKISVNGAFHKTINRGDFLELEIDNAINISSSAPMQVATYAKTTQTTQSSKIGDPLMMLIHPKEQFYKEYKFINTQTKEENEDVYKNQYVAVILPSSGKSSLSLDGTPVPTSGYLSIPNSDYEYKVIRTTDGVHQISCNENIAIYIYGYGQANSYGYIGGMSFKIFDHKDPVIIEEIDCFRADVAISDTLPYDSGIEYFNIDIEKNVTIDIDNAALPEVVKFDATVNNRFVDADITYTVRDSMGFSYTKNISIPGFTVSIGAVIDTVLYHREHVDSKLYEEYCFDLKLENYGRFPQKITDINFNKIGKAYGLEKIPLPFTIAPGSSRTYELCFSSDVPIEIRDSIKISNDCMERSIATVSYQYFADTDAPEVEVNEEDCNRFVNIVATDSSRFDLGINTIEYLEMENITIVSESKSPNYVARLSISNSRMPAWYSIRITDNYGNETLIADTLSPATLRFANTIDSNPDKEERYFGEFTIGSICRDSVYLENYGEYPQRINDAYAILNRHFSVPRSQFPLIIPPLSTVGVEVIYHPDYVRAERYRDTIFITSDCFDGLMPVAADAAPIEFEAMSQCDIPLTISSSGVPFEMYVANPTPIPSSEKVTIRYKANFARPIQYKLYTNNGSLVQTGNLYITEGEGNLDIPIHQIGNGQYLLKLNNDLINESFIIIKQN